MLLCYDLTPKLLVPLLCKFGGVKQSSGPHLDHEDLEQLDEFDLEEMDLKWQVATISIRLKKFYKKTGHFARECRSKGNQESRRRDAGNTGYRTKDNRRRPRKQEEPKALVTLNGEGIDWTGHAEDEQENFALMDNSNSGSDTEEQLGDADDKTDVLTYNKKLLAEAVKEKEELKTKLENFQSSSKGLNKLLNSQMSTRDKFRLGYGDQVHEGVLSYKNEVLQSVFDSSSSDVEDSPAHDRFVNIEGMHAVPPPMTGNYIPSRPDKEVDDSMFTYGPKQSKTSESDTQSSNFDSCKSNSSVETLKTVPEPVVVEPKVVSQPKVWSDAPIIKEYESDSDDEYVIQPSKEQEIPSFTFVNTFKHVKTPRETFKEQNTYNSSPKADKGDLEWFNVIRLNEPKEGKGTVRGELDQFNTARQNLSSQAATTSTARKVNTARPIVNTAEDKAVSAIGGIKETAVKPSAGCNWRPKRHYWNKVSKYNSGSSFSKNDNPQIVLKNKGIIDSGCSRHMTGNKAYLAEYQDYNGGPVAFGGSKGYITGKGTECLVLSSDFKPPDEN
ncbi:hypothetical protein Tco_0416985 [Tanacetum coccineum]